MVARRFGPYLPTLGGGPAAADAVLASGTTAVVCHNDMLAIGMMRRLVERGRSIPADLSVVGFDNVFGAEFCHPTLTTLAERTEDAGARAVELLAQQVPQRQVEGPTRVLPTHLVVRASTGPAPA
jgi:LacI family transcriptional regulator